jgi:TonB-dependent starch-binding outer membrane protein SusC
LVKTLYKTLRMQHAILARYGRLLVWLIGLLLTSSAWAQYTVTGQVKATNGQGLPGVNLVIKGTTSGATTDANGNYQLSIRQSGPVAIVVSAVGYLSQTI